MYKQTIAAIAAVCTVVTSAGAMDNFTCADKAVPPYNDIDKAALTSFWVTIGNYHTELGDEVSGFCRLKDGGRFWHYKNGSIYWSAHSGANAVLEPFREYWKKTGWEKGRLGYPISSVIDTGDKTGTTVKFEHAQLILRPSKPGIREVSIGDLKVDLPTPPGEPWIINQANARVKGDSHAGPWAYCYDMSAVDQAKTKGANFVSTADARIAAENDQWGDDGCILDKQKPEKCQSNYVSQSLGRGRYASSIHLQRGSYIGSFGASNGGAVYWNTPWEDRPIAKSGQTIGRVGDSGTGLGNDHIHFCVTTAPDDKTYGANFESTPFVFRNYEVLKKTSPAAFTAPQWVKVAEGRPKAGDVVRRPVNAKGGPATIKALSGLDIMHGETVRGMIAIDPANLQIAPGVVTLRAYSPWGEPMSVPVTVKVNQASLQKGVPFEIKNVPVYASSWVIANYAPSTPAPRWAAPIEKKSLPFTPMPSTTNIVSIVLTK